MREGFGLHFQVDLSVDIGSIQRDMSQPGPDGVDVYAGAQQMDGSCMADGMGTYRFLA